MKFELGREAKDIVTGFKGRLTGMSTYLTGCDVYLIQPPVDKDGKRVEPIWFDENRIEYFGKKKALVLRQAKEDDPGACESAPVK